MKEKVIWLSGASLCIALYIVSKDIALLIWSGVALIMFRIAMLDERIEK